MIDNFDIVKNKALDIDENTTNRFLEYQKYRNMYEGNFAQVFSSTILKIRKIYPLDKTTSQSLIEINLFEAMTDFFKNLLTNSGLYINVDDSKQKEWDKISEDCNFIAVAKEVYIDNSRFGNGLFKVALVDDKVNIFSICPDCWVPVFNNGNLNDLAGHILMFSLSKNINGVKKQFKHIEKHRKGYIENEVWELNNDSFVRQLSDDELSEFGLEPVDDFSDYWEDFIIFPVKNTTVSDKFFGESDYNNCKSVVEELMLTVSQNSKIINRHANPKLTGSEQNLEHNPITGERTFPNSDFVKVGTDGVKPEYITADLQSEAIQKHVDMLMNFFYILTKTPPQAYGINISGNMSGESLRKVFMSALAKADDIKQVSLNNAIKNVAKCAMAFNKTPVDDVKVDWGEPIPLDTSEKAKIYNDRAYAETISKTTAIMELDNVSEADAQKEFERINKEKSFDNVPDPNGINNNNEEEDG